MEKSGSTNCDHVEEWRVDEAEEKKKEVLSRKGDGVRIEERDHECIELEEVEAEDERRARKGAEVNEDGDRGGEGGGEEQQEEEEEEVGREREERRGFIIPSLLITLASLRRDPKQAQEGKERRRSREEKRKSKEESEVFYLF